MSSRPVTPGSGAYGSMHDASLPTQHSDGVSHPHHLPSNSHPSRQSQLGTGGPEPQELEPTQGLPRPTSVLSQNEPIPVQNEDSTEPPSMLPRSNSQLSQSQTYLGSRGGTLKKKSSLRRSNSKRSSYAGSVKSLRLGEKEKYAETDENMSIFFCPVPTNAVPTQLLADRFQGVSSVPPFALLLTLEQHGERFSKTSSTISENWPKDLKLAPKHCSLRQM